MSRYSAVAAVTATIKHLLEAATKEPFPHCEVTTDRPEAAARGWDAKKPRINLYLFQVLPNPSFRNAALPNYPQTGAKLKHPFRPLQTAIDLNYLLSFFGDDDKLSGQQLMGIATTVLHTYTELTGDILRWVGRSQKYEWVRESGLIEQPVPVRIAPLSLSFEEISKFWSGFFQVPYTLSTTYQASAVLLDSDTLPVTGQTVEPLPPPLPVKEHRTAPRPGSLPHLDAPAPLVFRDGVSVQLRGAGLDVKDPLVDVGGLRLIPTAVTPSSMTVTLPKDTPAGRVAVQVGQRVTLDGEEHDVVLSNTVELEVRRTIRAAFKKQEKGKKAPRILVHAEPEVPADATAALLLTPEESGAPYTQRTTLPEASSELLFYLDGTKPGTYVVQLEVDGARSELAPEAVVVK